MKSPFAAAGAFVAVVVAVAGPLVLVGALVGAAAVAAAVIVGVDDGALVGRLVGAVVADACGAAVGATVGVGADVAVGALLLPPQPTRSPINKSMNQRRFNSLSSHYPAAEPVPPYTEGVCDGK